MSAGAVSKLPPGIDRHQPLRLLEESNNCLLPTRVGASEAGGASVVFAIRNLDW